MTPVEAPDRREAGREVADLTLPTLANQRLRLTETRQRPTTVSTRVLAVSAVDPGTLGP